MSPRDRRLERSGRVGEEGGEKAGGGGRLGASLCIFCLPAWGLFTWALTAAGVFETCWDARRLVFARPSSKGDLRRARGYSEACARREYALPGLGLTSSSQMVQMTAR